MSAMPKVSNVKWIIIIAAIVFASSRLAQAADEQKFKISAANTTAQAVVDSKQFEANMTLGDASEYAPPKIFEMVVGKCTLSIKAMGVPGTPDIQYEVKENGTLKGNVINPKSFVATKKDLNLLGQEDNLPKNFTLCESGGVTFDGHPKYTSKFLIEVKLSGSIPPNLELNSDALLYDPDAKEDEPSETDGLAAKKSEEGGLGLGAWIGIGCGALFVLLLSVGGGIAVFCVIRSRRKKQQSAEVKKGSAASVVKTALAAEAVPDKAFLEKQRVLVNTQDETGDQTATNEESSKRSRKATKTEGADNIQKNAAVNSPFLTLQAPEAKATLVYPQIKKDDNYEVIVNAQANPPPPPATPTVKQEELKLYEPLPSASQVAAITPAPKLDPAPKQVQVQRAPSKEKKDKKTTPKRKPSRNQRAKRSR